MGQLLFENVELEGINLDKTPYNYYFRNNKNKLVPKSQSWNEQQNNVAVDDWIITQRVKYLGIHNAINDKFHLYK